MTSVFLFASAFLAGDRRAGLDWYGFTLSFKGVPFWAAEGAGTHWPGDDASLPGVLAFVIGLSVALVALLRRQRHALAGAGA